MSPIHTHQLPSVYLWPTELPRTPATWMPKSQNQGHDLYPDYSSPSQSIATSALQHLRQKNPHLLQLDSQYNPVRGSPAHLKTAASLRTFPAPQAPSLSSTRELYPDRWFQRAQNTKSFQYSPSGKKSTLQWKQMHSIKKKIHPFRLSDSESIEAILQPCTIIGKTDNNAELSLAICMQILFSPVEFTNFLSQYERS